MLHNQLNLRHVQKYVGPKRIKILSVNSIWYKEICVTVCHVQYIACTKLCLVKCLYIMAPKPVGWTMCFLLAMSSLAWTLMIICRSVFVYIHIYVCALGSLILEVYICVCVCVCVLGSLILDVSADGGRDGLWWPALLGHWSYTGCWQSLLVMYWLMLLLLW